MIATPFGIYEREELLGSSKTKYQCSTPFGIYTCDTNSKKVVDFCDRFLSTPPEFSNVVLGKQPMQGPNVEIAREAERFIDSPLAQWICDRRAEPREALSEIWLKLTETAAKEDRIRNVAAFVWGNAPGLLRNWIKREARYLLIQTSRDDK